MASSDEHDERGIASIEYAMMVLGIALVLAGAVGPVGTAVATMFDLVAAAL